MADRTLVARYYAYRATLSVGFVTPVFTLFLLRDLSFTQVGALSALYSVLSVLGEVPTGYVGDRLGRRASLMLSVGFTVASLAGFVLAQSFLWYAFLYALWALALTFRSGSMDAWLYDALAERLDADSFSRVRGRGDAVQQWTNAATMVGGGLLYGIAPTYPFVAAVAFNSLGVLALLSLPKNAAYADGEAGDDGADGDSDVTDRPGPLATLSLLRERLWRPPLRSLVAYVAVFYAAVSVAQGYVQPMAVETLGPYAARLGVSLPAGGAVAAARSGEAGPALALALGVLYAGLSAVASVGGYYAGPLADRVGVRGVLLAVPVVAAVAMGLPLALGLLALPAFVAMRVGMPLVRPVANGYLNDHLERTGRATTLSAVSMAYMTLRTPLALAAGGFADLTTATAAVAGLGAVVLVGGGGVWVAGDVAPAGSESAGADEGADAEA